MPRFLLIRPGAAEFDEQRRIKGSLDIPLSSEGTDQVNRTASELHQLDITAIYCSPCQSAQETAGMLAKHRDLKFKPLDRLQNLDQGLWHGKQIDEVKQTQPKVYKKWQEHPETMCPPNGETLDSAEQRVKSVLQKLTKKYKQGIVALVVPEPLASVVRRAVSDCDLGDLWQAECHHGEWEILEGATKRPAVI